MQIKGIRSRFLIKKYGAPEERDTVAAINVLVQDHGIDLMDMQDLYEMGEHEQIYSLVPMGDLTSTDARQTIVLISTPTQLLNAAHASLSGYNFGIHVDGTHGMVLEDAQIILIGTHDIRQRGHRIAAAIVPNAGLNTQLMTCIFTQLKKLVELMAVARIGGEECPPGWQWNLSRILSDDEGAFRNAARVVWGDGLVVAMCSFHVAQATKKTGSSKLKNKDHIHEILEDVRCIQRCTEPNIKAELLNLFSQKWMAEGENEFVAYFEAQWARKLWSRADAPIGHATDNNTIERCDLMHIGHYSFLSYEGVVFIGDMLRALAISTRNIDSCMEKFLHILL